jgi:hypothetical protein
VDADGEEHGGEGGLGGVHGVGGNGLEGRVSKKDNSSPSP